MIARLRRFVTFEVGVRALRGRTASKDSVLFKVDAISPRSSPSFPHVHVRWKAEYDLILVVFNESGACTLLSAVLGVHFDAVGGLL